MSQDSRIHDKMSQERNKRPLMSPDDPRDPKKTNQSQRPDKFERSQLEISSKLQQIRVTCGLESQTYIPNSTQPNTGPRYKPASECSYAGTWNKGLTNVINIEIISFNGEEFRGSYKQPEALYIWKNILGKDADALHGISFKKIPRKHFQIVYILKEEKNIDDMFQRDDFSYNRGERKPDGSYDIICGRIMGLKPTTKSPPNPQTATRVNLYGCEFDLTKTQIINWMAKFG